MYLLPIYTGLINDIPSVQELVDRCIHEALATHKEVGDKFNKA